MPKKIAAANWKMNLKLNEATTLLQDLLALPYDLSNNQYTVLAVPFPYIPLALAQVANHNNWLIAAQNCSEYTSGAYTGEVSIAMLQSLGVHAVLIGHSERRQYFNESNETLAAKVDLAIAHNVMPIFCCGEPLTVRNAHTHNEYVALQLKASLMHLSAEQLSKVVIAYEPIWAIGTGVTASTAQAQEMHAHIRSTLTTQYGTTVASEVSILYGGSVSASNASELFACPDVDGGLVGGASLKAADFNTIINSLP